MKKTKTFFPLFFAFILIALIIPNNVNGIAYYNQILNPSFASYENWIEDGGFESGDFEKGKTYGNWSIRTSTPQIVTNFVKSGVYSLYLLASTEEAVWYNLTEYILGADLYEFIGYVRSSTVYTGMLEIDVYFSDGTGDTDTLFYSDTTFDKINFDSGNILNDAKYLKAFSLRKTNDGCNIWIDDLILEVDTGENCQDEITLTSYPWFQGQTVEDAPYFGYINTELGRLDSTSVQLDGIYTNYKIIQDITFLDSDTVHFVEMWVYGCEVSKGEGIKIELVYSDRSMSEKTVYAVGDGSSWENLNFGHAWIVNDKYIVQIRIYMAVASQDCNIDDVGVWSSFPLGFKRFYFTISPYPIHKGVFDFTAYQLQNYVMTCYLYDENNSLTESGNYQINDMTGITSGSFNNGKFTYTLNKRSSSSDITEQIVIIIIVGEEIMEFEITGYWEYVESAYIPTPERGEAIANLTIMFTFIFVPSIFLAGITNKAGIPVIGFIVGVVLMTSLGYICGIVPIWFVFVSVLSIVLLLFAMIKTGRSIMS